MPPTTASNPKPVKTVSTGPNEMPSTLAWKPRKTVLTRDPARATETSAASRPNGLMTAVTRPTNSREVLSRASGPAGIEAGQVRHDAHEEPGGDQGDPQEARQANPLTGDRHEHCAHHSADTEVCPQQPVVAGGCVQIAGNEEIAQGLQRAKAQPGQHLGDQDGAQHHVAGDIAHPVQELAREVAG